MPTVKEEPIEQQSLAALYAMQTIADKQAAIAKTRQTLIRAELTRRFADSVRRKITEAGKSHGTTTLELQDRMVAKAEVKQTVKWDSAKLMAIAQTLPWDRVAAIFKIDFAVSETIYKGLSAAAPELREKIDAARTTTIGEPVIKLVKDEG